MWTWPDNKPELSRLLTPNIFSPLCVCFFSVNVHRAHTQVRVFKDLDFYANASSPARILFALWTLEFGRRKFVSFSPNVSDTWRKCRKQVYENPEFVRPELRRTLQNVPYFWVTDIKLCPFTLRRCEKSAVFLYFMINELRIFTKSTFYFKQWRGVYTAAGAAMTQQFEVS